MLSVSSDDQVCIRQTFKHFEFADNPKRNKRYFYWVTIVVLHRISQFILGLCGFVSSQSEMSWRNSTIRFTNVGVSIRHVHSNLFQFKEELIRLRAQFVSPEKLVWLRVFIFVQMFFISSILRKRSQFLSLFTCFESHPKCLSCLHDLFCSHNRSNK